MRSIDLEQISFWYDTYGAQLVLYARGWLDWANAEDVVQEVFVQLMGQRRSPDCVRRKGRKKNRPKTDHLPLMKNLSIMKIIYQPRRNKG